MTSSDLLAPSPDRHAINGAALAGALRRKRATILALVIIGALLGTFVTLAFPAAKTATTLVYLRFPEGSDSSQAMPTEITVLSTRAVAGAALRALGSHDDPAKLQSKYRGTVASSTILRLTATGRNAATARGRADAVANAFLAYRVRLAQQQVDATVSALKAQQDRLRRQVRADDDAIAAAANSSGGQGTAYTELLDDRQQSEARIQQIDATIQNSQVSAQSVAQASRVIDAAYVTPTSTKKAIAKNAATGMLVGLVLGVGGVLFAAVVTTRVRRRADIAAVLHAPVVLSLGPVLPRGWRRVVHGAPTTDQPNPDLERVVGHLERTLTLTGTRALVIVSIDSLDVARLATLTLADRLRDRGRTVTLVNETGAPLPDSSPDAIGEDGADAVLVIAVLNPAGGAEHLREWGSNAVAIVTAGRTTEHALARNATMLRSASLDLGSVVLVGSDDFDTSLGILPDHGSAPTGSAVGEPEPRSTVESS